MELHVCEMQWAYAWCQSVAELFREQLFLLFCFHIVMLVNVCESDFKV
jgi:hypothetical protein